MNIKPPVFLFLVLLGGSVTALEVGGWTVGPRILPPPTHASEALRRQLGGMSAPNLAALKASLPATKSGWKTWIAARDAVTADVARTIARDTGVAVHEDRMAGVKVWRIDPPRVAPEHGQQLFLHIHGGAWMLSGGLAGAGEGMQLAAKLGMPVVSVDYRMPPDFPAPAAMDDIVGVWRELVKTHNPARMAMGGTSAGGNLTLVATLRARELGLPLPGALMVGTPAIDLNAAAGDSRFLNEGVDSRLTWEGFVTEAVKLYAAGQPYDDPHLSPIQADVAGFPPTYLISGTRDLLLSDTVLMHRKLRRAGVAADLHVYEGSSHADYLKYFGLPESDEHYTELQAFLHGHLQP